MISSPFNVFSFPFLPFSISCPSLLILNNFFSIYSFSQYISLFQDSLFSSQCLLLLTCSSHNVFLSQSRSRNSLIYYTTYIIPILYLAHGPGTKCPPFSISFFSISSPLNVLSFPCSPHSQYCLPPLKPRYFSVNVFFSQYPPSQSLPLYMYSPLHVFSSQYIRLSIFFLLNVLPSQYLPEIYLLHVLFQHLLFSMSSPLNAFSS